MAEIYECQCCGEILRYDWETNVCKYCLEKSEEARKERIQKIKADLDKGQINIHDMKFLVRYCLNNIGDSGIVI